MEKLIIIEPNLKNTSGHVYEAMRAMDKYLLNRKKKLHYYLISHKRISSLARRSFHNILPYAEVGCFDTHDFSKTANYLRSALQNLKVSKEDVIVFPTAHLNELKAVTKIYNENSPSFILQLHQFYPPLSDSDKINTNGINVRLNGAFRDVFYKINHKRIRVATVSVPALNKKLSKLSPVKLEQLPVPFLFPELKNAARNEFSVGFFGDGRKEKGLLKLLVAVHSIVKKLPKLKIVIQIQNPRCFTKKEVKRISYLVNDLKQLTNVKFIEGALSSDDYYKYLAKCFAIIIPYDPRHYKIRLSGIAIECGALGVPVITTGHTWAGNMVKMGKMTGTTFSFTNDQELFEERLIRAINKILKNKVTYQKMARKHNKFFLNNFSAKNYLKKIKLWSH